MSTPPTVSDVHEAIFTLYHCPDSAKKEVASQWLQAFQKSMYSWEISNEILHEKRNLESCYFAAQTMRSKIQYSFRELPLDSHVTLRDSLVEHIRQASEHASSAIVTQLCLALADFALQMSAWHSPVIDLINILGDGNSLPLLQILSVLPEEVNSTALRLGANRRNEILMSLKSVSDVVSEYTKYCLSHSEDSLIHIKVLRCISSWISVQAITPRNDVTEIVVERAFNILKNNAVTSDIHDAATDCLCALFPVLEDSDDQKSLEIKVLTGIMELEECFLVSVAHEEREKSVNLCCLFTEIAESFLEKILNKNSSEDHHPAINSFDLVLKCMGHYDHEVVEITFGLWYRLSDALYHRNSEYLNSMFKPYVHRLIVYLRRHCEMEADQTGLLECGDDFAEFREKVSELVKDIAFIPGPLNCFHLMFLSLQQPNAIWNSTEATLFVMKALAKQIIVKNDVVPKVVEIILQMPETTHIAVRYTSLLLLGDVCDCLVNEPESFEATLNFLLRSLQQPQLSTAAAIALQNICCTNRDYMTTHFNCLMQIIQFMDSFGVSNEAAIGLLKGVSLTLSRLPAAHIQEAMVHICRLQIARLNELVESDIQPEKGTSTDPAWCFDRLATVFKFVDLRTDATSVHPCLPVLTEVWPLLSKACNKYQGDARAMERCCRCLRFAIRCVGKQSTLIMEPLVQQIVELYQVHCHSCFLYLGSILVDEYGSVSGCEQGLLNMLCAFVSSTMKIFEEESGLKNNPDTVDDLFRLCSRFLQTMPVNFLKADTFPTIFNFAIFACSLDHGDANASVMKFFTHLINAGTYKQENNDQNLCQTLVKSILDERGLMIVSTMLHTAVFCLHPNMLFGVADVMFELMHADRASYCQWLQHSLQSLPTHNSSGSVSATQDQLNDFYHSITTAQGPKKVSHALRDFVRLYR